jgi:hypothetical protein
MAGRLIVTNGDAAVERLRAARFDAEIVPWRDALHDGPVPGGLLLEALSLIRVQFFSKELGRPVSEVSRRFAERDAAARNHGQFERVELWFEHDLYDQLQLIQILEFFRSEKRRDGLFLMQADDYLTSLLAESLRNVAAAARTVEEVDFEIAERVWTAFTAPTPEKLSAQTAAGAFRLPHLAPALRRLLHELPGVASGLSLTEEHILNGVARGSRTASELFEHVQAQEPARFLGDSLFFRRLDRLAFAPHPLIAGLAFASVTEDSGGAIGNFAGQRVRLSETGRAALAGRFDHATENGIDRWLGGTHLTSKSLWRRERSGQLALPPK